MKRLLSFFITVLAFMQSLYSQSSVVLYVNVDSTRTASQAIFATGRHVYGDSKIITEMSRGKGGDVRVSFFKPDIKPGHYLTYKGLEVEYRRRGLVPVDPYSLAAINEADSSFADEYPNTTSWETANGKCCVVMFYVRKDGEKRVELWRCEDGWTDIWWFAGIRR